jgi:Cdc6-like AAA superfamily ATPase
MDLSGLYQDTKCQNIIYAYRVMDTENRTDGKVDFISPQLIARRSTQKEVELALSSGEKGPKIFLATVHSGKNQLLQDDDGHYITTNLPEDMFFHQMLVCGKTGSGKTVAMKYLMQYFVEEMKGAVLAINVKDVDLLRMDQASNLKDPGIQNEWKNLEYKPRGVENFIIYYPANTVFPKNLGISQEKTERITLKVKEIDPDSLTGLLQNISEVGSQALPDIFRYWKEKNENKEVTFQDFVNHFRACIEDRTFPAMNIRGDVTEIMLQKNTIVNVERNLTFAIEFFDNKDAKSLQAENILFPGKLSVINVTGEKEIQFGSILLRDLLKKIVEAKRKEKFYTPILVIIDEVHQFYSNENAEEALGALDTICRTGRSSRIGVIFASQNQEDIPKGLSNVINTKIFFRSDSVKNMHLGISADEFQSLSAGYAVVNVHNLPHLRIIKFPVSLAGVFENERNN